MNESFKFLLILCNFLFFIIGLSTYLNQLSNTSFIFWIFVVDCPLALLCFIIYLFGFRNAFFEAFTRVLCFKYGLWTILVLFLTYGFNKGGVVLLNIFFHIILLLESFIVFENDLRIIHFLPVFLFSLLNDFLDYGFNMHPFFEQGLFDVVGILTIFLTFFSISLFLIIGRERVRRRITQLLLHFPDN